MDDESVRVIVRCRPLNQRETTLNSKICVSTDQQVRQCVLTGSENSPPKVFTFDSVYGIKSNTEHIYNDIVYPLVENVVEGYNGTVFAYGQTGSGKTFSMQGDINFGTQRGIIPRAFEHIFEAISTISDTKFLVHVSYLEIYNEDVRDLLNRDKERKLEIKEHPEQGVYVASLSMHVCHNAVDCERLMNDGFQNRHVGATLMNKDSSRSHSIFTVYVEGLSENGSIKTGKLHLVDLAGSERQSKTGATGERFKEATKINLSLSALGNVISALVDGKSTHIPYRDSKLTRLLQDSLGGNTKTVMIACISPSDNNYDETLSTLRYANRAKNIKNKPRINEDPKDALLREYKEEIERLKSLIQTSNTSQPSTSAITEDFEMEKIKLKKEYENAIEDLRNSYQSEQQSKERLQSDLEKLQRDYEKANEELEVARKAEEKNLDMNEAQQRIQLLEHQLIGGEQANNENLKQKRKKRIREAEKKMQQLTEIMNSKNDDAMQQAFASTQEKLDVLTKKFNTESEKVVALENEISDLQSEFATDRLDYLETIRKQEQQQMLLQQILDKLQPLMRRDSNYSDLEKIKQEAIWNEDLGSWIIPEVSEARSNLLDARVSTTHSAQNGFDVSAHSSRNHEQEADSRLKKRLDQSMDKNMRNYLKQMTKPVNILEKYDVDKHKNLVEEKVKKFQNRTQKIDALLNGVYYTEDVYDDEHRPEMSDAHKWWNKASRVSMPKNRLKINGLEPILRPQRLQAMNLPKNS